MSPRNFFSTCEKKVEKTKIVEKNENCDQKKLRNLKVLTRKGIKG